ncbi:MAG: hypothetical protein ACXWNQ_00100 [Anaerolineales bacterium]
MFLLGADENELRLCLTKKKVQLTAAGAKADNLPVKHEEQAKFVSALLENQMKHVRDWFSENGSFDNLPPTSKACTILADEVEAMKLDEAERKKLWRSILAAFVSSDKISEVDDFMKGSAPFPFSSLLPEAREAPIKVDSGAHTLRAPAGRDAGSNPSSLADAAVPPRGERTSPAAALSLEDVEIEDRSSLTVIGRRRNELPNGDFFIQIEGIVLGDALVELSLDEAREIFPKTGHAIGFRTAVQLAQGAAERLSIWRVEHKSPGKSAEYVITEFLSHVYEVVDVPHSSAEPDQVREWIRQIYQPVSNVLPVFQLADGPIIKVSHDTAEPGSIDFDIPLYGYRQHPVVKSHGRAIVLKKFPAPDFKYDCAPIRTVAKRLFKARSELAGIPTLTKAQATEIADAISNHSDAGLAQTAQRIKPRLAHLFASEDALDSLMDDILQLPAVHEAVEREKALLSERMRQEASASNAELSRLAAEKKQLQDEIATLKQSRRKEAANVAREVRLAFEQAGREGLKTLANVSLLKAVLNLDGSEQGAPPSPSAPDTEEAEPGNVRAADSVPVLPPAPPSTLISTVDVLAGVLAAWCLHKGLSKRMLNASIAGAAASGIVGLIGSRRDETAWAIAGSLASGTVCNVSVTGDMFGLTDLMNAPGVIAHPAGTLAMPLGDFINQCQSAGRIAVIRLRGVNRTPPESLLPELLDCARTSNIGASVTWTAKKGEVRIVHLTSPIVILLDFAYGRSVFPMAAELAAQLPLIDTDAPWGDYGDPDPTTKAPVAVIDPAFFAGLANQAASLAPQAAAGLIPASRREAARMKAALTGFRASTALAELSALLAYGVGRQQASKLSEAIPPGAGELAGACKTYAETAKFDHLFDMGADL